MEDFEDDFEAVEADDDTIIPDEFHRDDSEEALIKESDEFRAYFREETGQEYDAHEHGEFTEDLLKIREDARNENGDPITITEALKKMKSDVAYNDAFLEGFDSED